MKSYVDMLKDRIEQNYRDYREDMLSVLDSEGIFDRAREISAVDGVRELISSYPHAFVDEGDAAYLLEFEFPLRMLADAWERYLNDCSDDFEMAVDDVIEADDNNSNYITAALADKLRKKHGADFHMKAALLSEFVEAGEKFLLISDLLKREGDI